jgi:hypothetical protein
MSSGRPKNCCPTPGSSRSGFPGSYGVNGTGCISCLGYISYIPRDGSRFSLEWKGAGVTAATLESNTLTMNNEGSLFAYRK